jgi:Fe-S-cluster containining protein
MDIETDFEKIFAIGDSKDEENVNFRAFMKWYGGSLEEFDRIVHALYKQVEPHIDCTKCANCCKNRNPLLIEEDISRCAAAKDMTPNEFKEKYLEEDEEYQEGWFLKKLPCLFLKDNVCMIYEDRPETCREYPHLHTKEQLTKTWKYVNNYSICPIMYNVVELLKEHLDWDPESFDIDKMY